MSDGSSLDLTGSSLAYSSATRTLTLSLGTPKSSNGKPGTVKSSVLTLSLSPSVLDSSGVSLTNYTFTGSPGQQF